MCHVSCRSKKQPLDIQGCFVIDSKNDIIQNAHNDVYIQKSVINLFSFLVFHLRT